MNDPTNGDAEREDTRHGNDELPVTKRFSDADPESTEWPGLAPEATEDHPSAQQSTLNSNLNDPERWPNIEGYVIQQYLGGGGFGDVFKARSVKLGGPVAIKILKPQYSLDELMMKRFQQEVQAAALTRHTHVVQVLDTDISTQPPYENCRYLVTEYLPGGDLMTLFP